MTALASLRFWVRWQLAGRHRFICCVCGRVVPGERGRALCAESSGYCPEHLAELKAQTAATKSTGQRRPDSPAGLRDAKPAAHPVDLPPAPGACRQRETPGPAGSAISSSRTGRGVTNNERAALLAGGLLELDDQNGLARERSARAVDPVHAITPVGQSGRRSANLGESAACYKMPAGNESAQRCPPHPSEAPAGDQQGGGTVPSPARPSPGGCYDEPSYCLDCGACIGRT